jgi:EAL domain-containing protein (putative c-di-GMP-specific phosphodiesterase class I)
MNLDLIEGQSMSPHERCAAVAERSGLILTLGEWALATTCEQSMRWREAGLAPIRVAVNLSGVQVRHAMLLSTVASILESTGLPPGDLELEITETVIRPNDPATQETLQSLHDLGVGLSLDDFGTGTSSLTHLRNFPIQCVKVDRSFVSGIPDNEQARFLTGQGCEVLQGFLISRAIPADKLSRMLAQDQKEPDTPDDLEFE